MKKPRRAVDRIDRLANTLSEMTAPFRYRVATVFDSMCISLCVFDENKTQVATLCVAPLGDSEELSAEALLLKYESKNYWKTFFYDRLDSLTAGRPRRSSLRPRSESRRRLNVPTSD